MSLHTHRNTFKIQERPKAVASFLAQSMNERAIANKLGVDQSTISRDIKALKALSQRFIYDLAYCYKSCIDGIDEVKIKAWELFRQGENKNKPETLSTRDKLIALKLIKECNEAKFALFKDGPSILNIELLEARINNIESKPISH